MSNDAASALSAIKVLAHAHPELSLLVLHGSRARFEAVPGSFDKFWFDAVSFWCDAAPVLRAGYEAVLDGLDR